MSSSTISDDVFARVAHLSRLEIKPEETFIKDQLGQAADYAAVLNELDTTAVPPTFQVNHKHNVFRDDVITPSLPQRVALSQAAKTSNGYFVTQATIKK